MEVIIFIAVLVLLIVVHEFGHFIAAKLSGMRVDEFGIGFPPRLVRVAKIGETEYTINWLPIGGFVRIYGEDGLSQEKNLRHPRAFTSRPRILQLVVLAAGITMNLVFAYVLITGALVLGTPRALSAEEALTARDASLAIANVLPGSPAETAGIKAGDTIRSAKDTYGAWSGTDPKSFTTFIAASQGQSVELTFGNSSKTHTLTVTPIQGLVTSDPTRYALGVEVATIGVLPLSFGESLIQGALFTWSATKLTAIGLVHFFISVFTLHADLSQVAGPVGIAGAVGTAASAGFGDLLSLMAIISINLALINLLPIPALDGGRILFVLIEWVTRRPIHANVARAINSVGYVFLLLLMAVITYHDIYRLFS